MEKTVEDYLVRFVGDEESKKIRHWFDVEETSVEGTGKTLEEAQEDARKNMSNFARENNYQLIVRPIFTNNSNGDGNRISLGAILYRVFEVESFQPNPLNK